jgi:hypothetical protein
VECGREIAALNSKRNRAARHRRLADLSRRRQYGVERTLTINRIAALIKSADGE